MDNLGLVPKKENVAKFFWQNLLIPNYNETPPYPDSPF